MNLKTASVALVALTFILLLSLKINAQFSQQISKTWINERPSGTVGLMERLARNRQSKTPRSGSTDSSAVKFKPAADSGVSQTLADAVGQNAAQKEALAQAFRQIKQGYEAEVGKEGKSNNLAAAMTFFIAANVMTYWQIEPPSDQHTEKLFDSLQEAMAGVPAFAEMTDAEKQKMHDWLVCMGGFAMTNYLDAKQTGNREALSNIKTFADYSIRLVLGIEAAKLNFSAAGLNIQNNVSVSKTTAQAANSSIVGTWSKASSSPMGMTGTTDATLKQMSSVGTFRARYIFNSDGTYSFKSEMSPSSQVWWTTEESGTFSVSGETLTVSPKTSKATLRNLDGVIQKTQAKPLEKVTYKWKTHYFEGIGETNLVLEPTQPTARDGTVGGSSLFPNAHLYGQGDNLAWRF